MVDLNNDIVADVVMLSQYLAPMRMLTRVVVITLVAVSATPKGNHLTPKRLCVKSQITFIN